MGRARPMLTPKVMLIFLLAALVVAAAVVKFADEVACGEVTVTVASPVGIMMLLLDVRFAVLWKRSKFSFKVELEPAGGCWIQASLRACKSGNLYIRELRVKGLEWFVTDAQLLNPDADGRVFKHPRQAL